MYYFDEISPYKQSDDLIRLTLATGPASEPITKTDCKRHLSIAESDTSHDAELDVLIESARRKLEEDTGLAVISQTYTQVFPAFVDGLRLARSPLTAITSITYYDNTNTQQTLSASVYGVDLATRQIRLKADQDWPDIYARWDAVTVTFTAGYASAAAVPANIKHAMLTLVAYYFDLDRGDNPQATAPRTYQHLIANVTRATYP